MLPIVFIDMTSSLCSLKKMTTRFTTSKKPNFVNYFKNSVPLQKQLGQHAAQSHKYFSWRKPSCFGMQ